MTTLRTKPATYFPRVLALAVLAAAGLALAASPACAGGMRLLTDNDFLAGDRDDLYSFGLGFEVDHGPYTLSLRESAFTDRAAGLRFDETLLTLGRPFALPRGWSLWAEAGVVHVGRGIFGQGFQNDFHALIGGEEVRLDYVDGDAFDATVRLTAGRHYEVSRRLLAGPYVEASWAGGLRSHVFAGAQAGWFPRGPWSVLALAGVRASDADLAPLAPWTEEAALQAEVGLVYRDRVVLSWSTNAFGTGQEHVTLGYRVGAGASPARLLTR